MSKSEYIYNYKREYTLALHALHSLDRHGELDSDQAHMLREKMDSVWTLPEQQEMATLSESLRA